MQRWLFALVGLLAAHAGAAAGAEPAALFDEQTAPIFERRCLSCHNDDDRKGGLSLASAASLARGGDSGAAVEPNDSDGSLLWHYISGDEPEMPKIGDKLTAAEQQAIRRWIEAGAPWPADRTLVDKSYTDTNWWSLEPLARPAIPPLAAEDLARVGTPIDAFVLAKLREQGLQLSLEADRRTLIRRLTFDLHGLPPTPDEVAAFLADDAPRAYERLVDRLLASPRYGERWGRHWLDIVHYGDTHGYDKDKVRPHAWPYRDYVIRSLNADKPYERFVREQLAGDVFYPGEPDGIVGLGFIAAGPFDYVGHIELREGTLDKQITRNLDRDDMVATAMNTFTSFTVQCARCHNHKFDPISQEDYYSLQAVFAAVDRADRPYEADPTAAARRVELAARQAELEGQRQRLEAELIERAGPALREVDARLAHLASLQPQPPRPEFGYHSAISAAQDAVKWVQIDLGQATPIAHIVYVGCHDTFNNIGAGFGFPVRYRIEVSNDAEFAADVVVVADHTRADVSNPGVVPQSVSAGGQAARYVRITATRLAPRQNDFIFALGEVLVLTPEGANAAAGKTVTSLDSIEAPVRWSRRNLVDGYYYGIGQEDHSVEIAQLQQRRQETLRKVGGEAMVARLKQLDDDARAAAAELAQLPKPALVYAAATEFAPQGSFRPTGGRPRPIHVLIRGSEKQPGDEVGPGTVSSVSSLPARFDLGPDHAESARRAALAEWVVARENPLTWRSIVNRVWQYHFGRGIVETPNDFGRMGARPTHPELLDWLAVEFRDGGQSFKELHRLILHSSVYRQASAHRDDFAQLDAGNQFLWRQNRQRLEAEAIRDSVLWTAGKLRPEMYGPGFRAFGFQDDHSPHYKYHEHDPDDAASHRRSIYRFIVRSVPDPFMETLDCADPSLIVARRNETLTALQALALLNNRFMVRMAEHFAARVEPLGASPAEQVAAAYRLALAREPSEAELAALAPLAAEQGLPAVCRLLFNTNEFVFVD